MPFYPACSGSEEEGPNFIPPTMGTLLKRPRKLREAQLREDCSADPKADLAVHKAALGFHKKQALKHGIDTPKGMAHAEAMKSHMDDIQKSKEKLQQDQQKQMQKEYPRSNGVPPQQRGPLGQPMPQQEGDGPLGSHPLAGHGSLSQQSTTGTKGKFSPVPGIPNKKDQPSEDIRQDKPAVPLRRLQQNYLAPRYDKSHEADEGGPGSGPRRGVIGGGPKPWTKADKKAAKQRRGSQLKDPDAAENERLDKHLRNTKWDWGGDH